MNKSPGDQQVASERRLADHCVVSVVALEVTPGSESEFLALTGRIQALVRTKGYGTNQLLRDGEHPRRYYDIRIWRNADAASEAERDGDVGALRGDLDRCLQSTPLVDLAWAVEVGLMSAGPWQERRGRGDRRGAAVRRVLSMAVDGPDRRQGIDRRFGFRRACEVPRLDVVQAARLARDRAHARFSDFRVGAAIETTDGRIVTGCNIESASYGLTLCAERVALFKAISEGHRSFKQIAVVTDTLLPTPPCGACRQVLWELAGNVEVILADLSHIKGCHRLKDLLPHPFDARFTE